MILKNIDLFLKITEENKDFNFMFMDMIPSQFFNKYKNILKVVMTKML